MKTKIHKILGVALALVLVFSFSLVAAVPVAASPANYPQFITKDVCETSGAVTAEWSTTQQQSGTYSYHLVLPADASNAGIDLIHKNIYGSAGVGTLTLTDITTLHFYESVITDGDASNMGAGISLFLDMNDDGDWDWTNDAQIVFESPDVSGDEGHGFKLRDVDAGTYLGFDMGGGEIEPEELSRTLADWKTEGSYNDYVVLWVSIDVGWGLYNNYEGYFDDITINTTTYEVEPAMIVDGEDTALATVADGDSFYLHMTSPVVNSHPATPDSLDATLNVYDGVGLVSTADYVATENGQTTSEFWTAAIDTDDLGVRPGNELQASGVSSFVEAVISFDKSYYDVNETMTITLQDDSWNTNATDAETVSLGTCTIEDGVGPNTIAANWVETGEDTGVFTKWFKPSDEGFVVGDSMTVTYTNADTAPSGVTDTAAVLLKSDSSTIFNKGTYAVTAATATITVTDQDKNADIGAAEDILGDPVLVENLSTGDSVTIAKLTENGTDTEEFEGTVTFGTGTGELPINDGDQLKATYTDPSDPTDVSTATAAIGYTVFLYDESDELVHSYTTIQAAVDAAGGNDDYTIAIRSGYASSDETWPVTVDNNDTGLTIKAEDGATVILNPADTENAIDVDDASVTIEGLTFKNTDATASTNNLLDVLIGGISLTVEDCIFDLTAGAANDIGINLGAAATGVTVTGCSFDIGEDAKGVSVSDAGAGITLSGGNLVGSSGTGIEVTADATATVKSSTFDGLDKAFDISNGTVLIKWNTIQNSDLATAGAIHITGATDVDIIGNAIRDNTGYPVSVSANADLVDLVFNNITGNAKGVKNDTGTELNAKHNWWGTADGPSASDIVGLAADFDTDYYLTATVKLTAEYSKIAGTSFNFKVPTGVKVSTSDTINYAGAAEYTGSPKAALSNASFYDVFIDPSLGTGDTVSAYFYTEGLSGDSVAYFWNNLTGTWDACSNQGYNTYDNYIWVLARDQTAEAATYPTIQELTGSMFAISGEEAPPEFDPWIYDENEDGVISKVEALNAVVDYFAGDRTKAEALEVIALYFAS